MRLVTSILRLWGVAFLVCTTVAISCRREQPSSPAIVVEATVSPATAGAGTPLTVHYRFVAPQPLDRAAARDWVFVHVVNERTGQTWTDDHAPPVPFDQWAPGMPVEYSRTMFVPPKADGGTYRLEVGMYSPADGSRPALRAQTRGQTIVVRVVSPQMEPVSVFGEGWYELEGESPDDRHAGLEWHWSSAKATVTVANPKTGARLVIRLDQPLPNGPLGQHAVIAVNGHAIGSVEVRPGQPANVHSFPVGADILGTGDAALVTVEVDKTFVPARMGAGTDDPRELGIRLLDVALVHTAAG